MESSTIVYIAGPMRGIERYNFPAFYQAEEDLIKKGYKTINPARLDEEAGFDPDTSEVTDEFLDGARKRDVIALLTKADALVLLPGWENSVGSNAELGLARWKGIPVLLYPSMTHLGKEDVLEEAMRLTSGDRQAQYGPPDQDFQRTAKMWSALKGVEFTAGEVAMFMICIKLSRQTHQNKRDNWTDIAGYARCGSKCRKEQNG